MVTAPPLAIPGGDARQMARADRDLTQVPRQGDKKREGGANAREMEIEKRAYARFSLACTFEFTDKPVAVCKVVRNALQLSVSSSWPLVTVSSFTFINPGLARARADNQPGRWPLPGSRNRIRLPRHSRGSRALNFDSAKSLLPVDEQFSREL